MFIKWKNQRFIKIRVLFWPEISALGVFFNFDNERMHPPKYPSAPPGTILQRIKLLTELCSILQIFTMAMLLLLQHQNWESSQIVNDIAIIRLALVADVSRDDVGVACLPETANQDYAGNMECWISGWGAT